MLIRMSLFPVCFLCVCVFCAQPCSVNLTFCVCFLCVYCVHCVYVCVCTFKIIVFLVFTVVCLHVVVFFLVFHEFESPGIELATVKVVIPFLNFADIHAFYYFLYFFIC